MVSPQAAEGARLLSQGRANDAIHAFRAGLTTAPRDVECHLGLARAYLSQLKVQDARKALERLLAIDARHLEGQSHLAMLDANEGDERALQQLKAFSSRPEAGFFEHFNLATALQTRGDSEGAEAAFEKAVKSQPRSSHSWFELGALAQKRGDLSKAISRFEKAAELAPKSHVPLYMLARAHAAKGEVGRAVEAIKKAISVAPREEGLYEELYKLCFAAGALEGVLTAAKALRALDPKNGNYAYMQGVAQITAGQVEEARGTLAEAMRLVPAAWEVKHALARCHQLAGDDAAALSLLEAVHSQVPTEPDPANDLALLYLAKPDAEAARRVLQSVLEAHPSHAGAHLNLALALARQEPARAAEHARRAQQGGDAEISLQATKLLKKLGST